MTHPVPAAGPTTTIPTADGRELAWVAFGEPDAPLVIHQHGGPSSRLEGRLIADGAVRNGLRLVCVDRPGIGRSSPHPGRSFQSWAEDVLTLADALGASTFGVSGWSEGGPWALAAAASIDPSRLRHVSVIAGAAYGAFGDNSAGPHLAKTDAFGARLALHHHLGFRLMYELVELDVVRFRSAYLKTLMKTLTPDDAALLSDPVVADAFADASAECFAQGVDGLVADAELLYRAWSFDVSTIERPVHLWQGSADHLVPVAINEQVAARMPGAVWHLVEGEDHLLPIRHSEAVFAVAAAELG